MHNVHVVNHPLIADHLTKMRDKNTPSEDFRRYLSSIASCLAMEATRNLCLAEKTVETPLTTYKGHELAGTPPLIVPILRAGLALSESLSTFIPSADTGHIGLYRDEETHEPVEYLVRLPDNLNRRVFITDPMLATGGSLLKTIEILLNYGVCIENISVITLLCAPEGLKILHKNYPDIPVYTAAIDSHLNENAFIVPGLGDAGDRYFGTN